MNEYSVNMVTLNCMIEMVLAEAGRLLILKDPESCGRMIDGRC